MASDKPTMYDVCRDEFDRELSEKYEAEFTYIPCNGWLAAIPKGAFANLTVDQCIKYDVMVHRRNYGVAATKLMALGYLMPMLPTGLAIVDAPEFKAGQPFYPTTMIVHGAHHLDRYGQLAPELHEYDVDRLRRVAAKKGVERPALHEHALGVGSAVFDFDEPATDDENKALWSPYFPELDLDEYVVCVYADALTWTRFVRANINQFTANDGEGEIRAPPGDKTDRNLYVGGRPMTTRLTDNRRLARMPGTDQAYAAHIRALFTGANQEMLDPAWRDYLFGSRVPSRGDIILEQLHRMLTGWFATGSVDECAKLAAPRVLLSCVASHVLFTYRVFGLAPNARRPVAALNAYMEAVEANYWDTHRRTLIAKTHDYVAMASVGQFMRGEASPVAMRTYREDTSRLDDMKPLVADKKGDKKNRGRCPWPIPVHVAMEENVRLYRAKKTEVERHETTPADRLHYVKCAMDNSRQLYLHLLAVNDSFLSADKFTSNFEMMTRHNTDNPNATVTVPEKPASKDYKVRASCGTLVQDYELPLATAMLGTLAWNECLFKLKVVLPALVFTPGRDNATLMMTAVEGEEQPAAAAAVRRAPVFEGMLHPDGGTIECEECGHERYDQCLCSLVVLGAMGANYKPLDTIQQFRHAYNYAHAKKNDNLYNNQYTRYTNMSMLPVTDGNGNCGIFGDVSVHLSGRKDGFGLKAKRLAARAGDTSGEPADKASAPSFSATTAAPSSSEDVPMDECMQLARLVKTVVKSVPESCRLPANKDVDESEDEYAVRMLRIELTCKRNKELMSVHADQQPPILTKKPPPRKQRNENAVSAEGGEVECKWTPPVGGKRRVLDDDSSSVATTDDTQPPPAKKAKGVCTAEGKAAMRDLIDSAVYAALDKENWEEHCQSVTSAVTKTVAKLMEGADDPRATSTTYMAYGVMYMVNSVVGRVDNSGSSSPNNSVLVRAVEEALTAVADSMTDIQAEVAKELGMDADQLEDEYVNVVTRGAKPKRLMFGWIDTHTMDTVGTRIALNNWMCVNRHRAEILKQGAPALTALKEAPNPVRFNKTIKVRTLAVDQQTGECRLSDHPARDMKLERDLYLPIKTKLQFNAMERDPDSFNNNNKNKKTDAGGAVNTNAMDSTCARVQVASEATAVPNGCRQGYKPVRLLNVAGDGNTTANVVHNGPKRAAALLAVLRQRGLRLNKLGSAGSLSAANECDAIAYLDEYLRNRSSASKVRGCHTFLVERLLRVVKRACKMVGAAMERVMTWLNTVMKMDRACTFRACAQRVAEVKAAYNTVAASVIEAACKRAPELAVALTVFCVGSELYGPGSLAADNTFDAGRETDMMFTSAMVATALRLYVGPGCNKVDKKEDDKPYRLVPVQTTLMTRDDGVKTMFCGEQAYVNTAYVTTLTSVGSYPSAASDNTTFTAVRGGTFPVSNKAKVLAASRCPPLTELVMVNKDVNEPVSIVKVNAVPGFDGVRVDKNEIEAILEQVTLETFVEMVEQRVAEPKTGQKFAVKLRAYFHTQMDRTLVDAIKAGDDALDAADVYAACLELHGAGRGMDAELEEEYRRVVVPVVMRVDDATTANYELMSGSEEDGEMDVDSFGFDDDDMMMM